MNVGDMTGQSYESAKDLSRHCGYCDGSGLVTVYHPGYAGSPVGDVEGTDRYGEVRTVRVVMRAVAHCGCPLGRWMRGKTDLDLLRRWPDFVDVIEGRSGWLAADPTVHESLPAARRPSVARIKAAAVTSVGRRGVL